MCGIQVTSDLQSCTGTVHLVLKFISRDIVWGLSVRMVATDPPHHTAITASWSTTSAYPWEDTDTSQMMASQGAGPDIQSLNSCAALSPGIVPNKCYSRSQTTCSLCHSPLIDRYLLSLQFQEIGYGHYTILSLVVGRLLLEHGCQNTFATITSQLNTHLGSSESGCWWNKGDLGYATKPLSTIKVPVEKRAITLEGALKQVNQSSSQRVNAHEEPRQL